MQVESARTELLGRCIDALIRGDDWRPLNQGPEAPDIEALMRVAVSLWDAADDAPGASQRHRFRVWERLFHGNRVFGAASEPLSIRRIIGRRRQPSAIRRSGVLFAPSHGAPGRRWL